MTSLEKNDKVGGDIETMVVYENYFNHFENGSKGILLSAASAIDFQLINGLTILI